MHLLTRTHITLATAFFAFLAFLDAAYLTIVHYRHIIPPCSVSGSCETVLTSQYAVVFGIPIALIGALYYVFLLALLILSHETRQRLLTQVTFFFTSMALVISIILIFVQAEMLHMFCQYCLFVEALNTLIWILSLLQLVVKRYRHDIPVIAS